MIYREETELCRISESTTEVDRTANIEGGIVMAASERVEVADYDEAWPDTFEDERERLISAVGAYLTGGVEHVGSTSVPGLAAKPIVDIQVGVADLAESRPTFGPLEAIGYRYASVRADVMHFFEKRPCGMQSYNLQLIPYRSDCWIRRIAFRDYLRSHAAAAREYAALKQRLAQRYPVDVGSYNLGKSSFIRRVTERALRSPDGAGSIAFQA
jgi:GrpB-like predicted nucleotidyltransferase (UPF0157 family)